MNTSKLVLAAAVAVLGLSGCNEMQGEINILQPIKMNVKKGNPNIPAGHYRAKIDFPEKNQVRVKVMSGKKEFSRFNFKTGRMPNGEINLPASENGQNYDLAGFLDSTERRQRGISRESCTAHGGPYGNPRSGWQSIYYTETITSYALQLDMSNPSTGEVVAQAEGAQTVVERLVEHTSPCL